MNEKSQLTKYFLSQRPPPQCHPSDNFENNQNESGRDKYRVTVLIPLAQTVNTGKKERKVSNINNLKYLNWFSSHSF
ncbi:MAG: hypothetical protein ACI86X_000582 [Moritella sp.]|jgi:hypothetical protein